MTPSPRVLIAGGGIGGLTLARALQAAGIGCTVFERAETLRPVGAGIIMQMNAMTALRSLGLADAVAQAGLPLAALSTLDPSGRRITRLPLARIEQEFGGPAIAIRRSRLQEVLLTGLEPERLRTGCAVTGFREEGTRVTVTLSDGTSATGDVLVGADGLRSVVREGLWGDGLRYSGYTSWRGITRELERSEPREATETWGPGARFGIVPVGHGELYWYATRDAPAGGQDTPGEGRAALRECFGRWHAPIAAVLDSTPEAQFFRTDIHDRRPLPRWSQGRVTLLGDAAHPMTPNMGQGGCQAIEDAVVLARCLAREAEVPAAFTAYEHRRLRRANAIVTQSFQLGRVAQLTNPVGRFLRDHLARLTPERANLQRLRTLMRFEP
ncbi:FAD-dependent monooxygenase [Archangium primigenium]|uniref:FAD-dependent monooxygenase n=1 Tax=[Archangium] primigenium TaxID=2792470 RepID=UPI0019573C11|nr:FAD-dependent monooxygenase [Archangium primigenium]MBM7118395.1 FAD-dependent monooxygenase [Archangium primigenium]